MSGNGWLKINIGCGLSGAAGWYNIDNSPTILLSRIPFAQKLFRLPLWPPNIHRRDVRKGLHFGDGSVDCIYSSHTFEHFTWKESLDLAKECFRVLKPGGVFRIVVPDLQLVVRDYLKDPSDHAAQVFLDRLSLNHNFHDWIHPGSNHSQMFDERSLGHLFREAGFAKPEVKIFMQSEIPDIADVELAVRKDESLYMEACRTPR